MQNGVGAPVEHGDGRSRAVARDSREAVLLGESALVQLLDVGEGPSPRGAVENAFGERVTVVAPDGPVARLRHVAERAAAGARVGLLSSCRELAVGADVMLEIADRRLGVVLHAFERGPGDAAFALAGLGWAVLFASDVEESLDLTLVARRAAEDSGTPFLIVHEGASGAAPLRRLEPIHPLTPAFVDAFVGPAETRLRRFTDPGHPAHAQVSARFFAERVPFALASALRELESLTGRKRDVVTRSEPGKGGDASLMLVGLGALGDILLGEVPRLRALGHDVGALKLTAFRPFPGPRLVRLLARSLAVTVLAHGDVPLAQSNPLTCELKAGFSDALTWAPEYPGIGRIPRVCSGVARANTHEVEAHDLDAVVANMLAGEQGKRFFVLGGDHALDLPAATSHAPRSNVHSATVAPTFHLRGIAADAVVAATAAELASAVVASLLSLKVRAIIRPLPDASGAAFDLAVAPHRPLGVHLSSAIDVVVLAEAGALIRGNPIARLAHKGTVVVPSQRSSAEAVWSEMPPYVKAVVFDREAELVGWSPPPPSSEDDSRWLAAAAFTGVVLGALAHARDIDPSLVERDVDVAVRVLTSPDAPVAAKAAGVARRAFEARVTVPRSVIEGDQEAIRLGRQDARATVP